MAHFWRLKQSFDPTKRPPTDPKSYLSEAPEPVRRGGAALYQAAGTAIVAQYYAGLPGKVSHRSLIWGTAHAIRSGGAHGVGPGAGEELGTASVLICGKEEARAMIVAPDP